MDAINLQAKHPPDLTPKYLGLIMMKEQGNERIEDGAWKGKGKRGLVRICWPIVRKRMGEIFGDILILDSPRSAKNSTVYRDRNRGNNFSRQSEILSFEAPLPEHNTGS